MIPFSVGLAFYAIILMDKLLKNCKIKVAYTVALMIFIGIRLKVSAFDFAWNYGEDGRATQEMLQYVVENTYSDSIILSALDSPERDGTICQYLKYDNRENVKIYDADRGNIVDEVDFVIFDAKNEVDMGLDTSIWEKTVFRQLFAVYTKIGAD